jgi:type II secretory ATPase GspE/PulE/Tfp pilus assembly ATPase PilB-like protein
MSRTVSFLQSLADAESIDIPELVDCLLLDAVTAGATDLHIEPWESTVAVRIRLDGVLNELIHLPLGLMDRIAARLKVMANLVSYQNDLPQDGHISKDPHLGQAELRVSFFPGVRGEKIVVRIFDASTRSFELESLGLDAEMLATFLALLARPNGLILLTGPTGSGKTTVIYGALTHLVRRAGPAISISTIEDPVEVDLPMVTQGQINPLREFTYPVALRSLLRQDPQVIMVGEIRDLETAAIALQAGLTGHLVLSTIHSDGSAGVFARLINMGLEPFLLSSSVAGVMSVRLVRRNCPTCSVPDQPADALLRLVPDDRLPGAEFSRGQGCAACHHTGYRGRLLVAELLVVGDAVREAVLQRLPTRALQDVAIAAGMRRLWQTGLTHALSGQTTLDELLRVVPFDRR